MYVRDLSVLEQPQYNAQMLAVGWLVSGEKFDKSKVSVEFFDKLVSLAVNPWQPVVAAGIHRCTFCRFTGGPSEIYHNKMTIDVGSTDLIVPGNTMAYVAPSLIVHYVDAHEYSPPQEFVDAVLDCPEMGSSSYLSALSRCGVPASEM